MKKRITTYTFFIKKSIKITVEGSANDDTYNEAERRLFKYHPNFDADDISDYEAKEQVDDDAHYDERLERELMEAVNG